MRWMRGLEARNRRVKRSIHAEAFSSKSHTRPSDEPMNLGLAKLTFSRGLWATKVGDEDDERDVADIDSGSGLLGIECVFPWPTRSSWRPPIQLRKGDGHTAITTSSLDFTTWTTCKKPSTSLLSLTSCNTARFLLLCFARFFKLYINMVTALFPACQRRRMQDAGV
jgi:hypothetical protein